MVKLEKEKLLQMYERMVRIRKFELKVEELHIKGMLPGLKHLYIGEEAIAVGVCSASKVRREVFRRRPSMSNILRTSSRLSGSL